MQLHILMWNLLSWVLKSQFKFTMYLDMHIKILWVDKIKWIKGYDSNGTLKWGDLGAQPTEVIGFLNLKGIKITVY